MHSLDDPMIMREIIMDHYQNPRNHGLVDDDSYQKVNMDSSTCIDDIDVQAKFNGDVVEDVRFDGEACAICTASTSIMTELVKGKTKEEAMHIVDNYMHMIYEKEYDPELLEEAIKIENSIIEQGWESYTTYNNLAILNQKQGNLGEAEQILNEMEDRYGDDYNIEKRFAYLEIDYQEQNDIKNRDYSKFAAYYDKAEKMYYDQLKNNKTDTEMQLLENIYQQVRSGGWLE